VATTGGGPAPSETDTDIARRFVDLVCEDAEWVEQEFREIVASWGGEGDLAPDRAVDLGTPDDDRSADADCPDRWRPRAPQDRRTGPGWARLRGPPTGADQRIASELPVPPEQSAGSRVVRRHEVKLREQFRWLLRPWERPDPALRTPAG